MLNNIYIFTIYQLKLTKIMLSVKTDIKRHRQTITYTHPINDDTSIVFEVVYRMKFDVKTKTLKFIIKSTKVYLEREKNRYHIKHTTKSDRLLTVDGFSLWLAVDLWIPKEDQRFGFLNDLQFDKLTISVSQ